MANRIGKYKVSKKESAISLVDGGVVTGAIIGGAHSVLAAAGETSTSTTDTETLASASIPANTLKAGNVLKIRAHGVVVNSNSSDTLTAAITFGGATITSAAALDVANNDIVIFDTYITVRTSGGSGTMVANTKAMVDAPDGASGTGDIMASAALDTTSAQTIAFTSDWSSAHANNDFRAESLVVEII